MNAIIIAYAGIVKRINFEQGFNPFAPPPGPAKKTKFRYAPDPKTLPPLTPDAFDAMFPGKRTVVAQPKRKKK